LEHRHHARCSAAAAPGPFTFPGTERQYERARPFRVTHLALDLTLEWDERALHGTATLEFERVSPTEVHLELDAIGFDLEAVRLDTGKGFSAADHHYDGRKIEVHVPVKASRAKVQIAYRVQPRRGVYFIAGDKLGGDGLGAGKRGRSKRGGGKGSPEQLWTQCQDEDARHWFPCHDKPHVKMTSEVRVRVPNGLVALSNGELVSSETPKGRLPWTYHFRLDAPHPSYLVTLVVGRFAVVRDRDAVVGARKIPVTYYVPPERRGDVERSLGRTPAMIELFSKRLGVPYPYSRYSQVVVSDFVFGGMENTTATTLYEHVLLDERAALDVSSHDLVAHELAHQWFGDHVTCRDWSHAWLNEGFATYFEHLEREDRLGRDEYEQGITQDVESYLSEAGGAYSRPIVCRDFAIPIELFDRHLYEKGGLVLHLLRKKLGDELFFRGVQKYLEQLGGGIAETNDLMRALEEVSGTSLERFFDEWVFRPGHPVLDVKASWDHGQLVVQVKQTQRTGETAVFALDLEVEVGEESGKVRRLRKEMRGTTDALVLDLPKRPAWVAFDPEYRIVGSVKFSAPGDLLRKSVERATTARLRAQAAHALSDRDDAPTVRALAKALANEREVWMVRGACAAALGRIRGEDAREALLEATVAKHPKVRRAVAAALGGFHTEPVAKRLATLAQSDASYVVAAEAARSLGRTRQRSALRPLFALLKEDSWADVRRAGALDGLAALRDAEAVPRVLEHTRAGLPSRGRRAAILALARLADDRRSREHLEQLLEDSDPHIRISVVSALGVLGDARSRDALRRLLDQELDGRVVRRIREVLRDLERSDTALRKRLSDELEDVRRELGEFKTRIAKLEEARRPKGAAGSTRKARHGAKARPASARGRS
jgi:aminopeptidase N